MLNLCTDAESWHHPHFLSADPSASGVRYSFRLFTGDEPMPAVPERFNELLSADQDSNAATAPWRLYGRIEDEIRAAKNLWQAARYQRDGVAIMRRAVPVVQAYRRATAAAEAAYAALEETPDGQWAATVLRLVSARTAVLAAAERLDGVNDELAVLDEGLPERVLALLPSWSNVAAVAGVDVSGWDNLGLNSRWSTSLVTAWQEKFTAQDEQIKAVSRLLPAVGDVLKEL